VGWRCITPAECSSHAELETAERLAIDDGVGDRPVDVQIADAKLPLRLRDVRRAP
jgi:hypothetical protein